MHVYSFNDAKVASRHRIRPYYIFGSRSIYKDEWKAGLSFQSATGATGIFASSISIPDPANNDWQLYNLNEDFNERNDLAKTNPKKLEELKALSKEQAKK